MNCITDKVKLGLPLDDVMIIDGHCHMGYYPNFNIPKNDAEGMLISMNTLGINYACVAAMCSIGPDYKYGNDMVADAISRYPDRFIGYVTVNPNYEDDMKNELDRCFARNGFKAIKIHPANHGHSIDSKRYHIVYETGEERQCHILIHTWGRQDVALLKKIASQYPRANFIMGHSGGDVRAMEDIIDIVNSSDNVYADLAISINYEGNVEWLVKEMGSKRVLYGSDMPFFDPRPNFGRVAMADISEDEKRDILGLNMKKLLKL
jgi:predicted TIM-barrel fold metal-dependent hydrolase